MSAFIHDRFGQAGTRLRADFFEQLLLFDTREQALLALPLFQAPAASLGSGHSDFVLVSTDQLIGLVQEKLVRQDTIDKSTEVSPLRQITVDSLELLAKRHKDWKTSLASVCMPVPSRQPIFLTDSQASIAVAQSLNVPQQHWVII